MRVAIPGGSGQVGTLLAGAFHGEGHEVTVFSRGPRPQRWRTAPWGELDLDGFDVVINLAGRSVNCRYHAENRRLILDSRTETTRTPSIGNSSRRTPRIGEQNEAHSLAVVGRSAPDRRRLRAS